VATPDNYNGSVANPFARLFARVVPFYGFASKVVNCVQLLQGDDDTGRRFCSIRSIQ
jgi:hypothetical protein